jgi:hypothetical protein
MSRFEDAKKAYESAEIPDELGDRVRAGMAEASKGNGISMGKRIGKAVGIAAACAICAGVIGLNTNQAFAEYMGNVPVIGSIAQVLTVRSYDAQDANVHYHINVPAVSGDSALAKKVNREISDTVNARAEDAKKDIADYKQAFFDTGGTQAEWDEHDLEVYADYSVKCENDNILSFVVTTSETQSVGFENQYFYNLDMSSGKELTLSDMLGSDYVNVCNKQIAAQIAERGKDPNNSYFPADQGGFTTIADDQNFYINDKGNVVIVFDKYTIAPGSMGVQEFEITK